MRSFALLSVLGAVLLMTACKTVKPVRPLEQYDVTNRFEEKPSIITIPVVVSLDGLEETLNAQFGEVLYEDLNPHDGDKMEVVARKLDRIKLSATDSSFSYIVPVDLWIRYDVGIGKVEATGKVRLAFRTSYLIQPDWTLVTSSRLMGYEWEEKPRLRFGVVGMRAEAIANRIISRSERTIGELIDENLAERLQLRQQMEDVWTALYRPIEISAEYKSWLMPNPHDIRMSPVRIRGRELHTSLYIDSRPRLSFGAPAASPVVRLPLFRYQHNRKTEGFRIFLSAGLPYGEAERLTRMNVIGQRFEQGRQYVVVEDIELYGQGNNLVVNLRLSGSYEGDIYLTGEPVFNPRRNRIEIEDLDYTLSTRNVLLRSAGWLVKGTLKQKIQDNMDYLLEYNLADAQRQLQESLDGYEPAPGIQLNGKLAAVDLYNAYLTTDGIQVVVAMVGELSLQISRLGK